MRSLTFLAAAAAILAVTGCSSTGHGAAGLPRLPAEPGVIVPRVANQTAGFMKGADVSMLAQIEANGGIFRQEDGTAQDALLILRNHGVNWVRLRLWNNPVGTSGIFSGQPLGGGNDDLATVTTLARRAKALGMKVLLDLHYSDFWADPGQQNPPAAWQGLPAAGLEQALYAYTRQVMIDMKAAGAAPDMVQLGNEINNGILWPVGRVGSGMFPFDELIKLLQAGSRAVREVSPSCKVMIHIANAGDTVGVETFFDNVNPWVDFDVIGLSYYPFWHGTIADLQKTLDAIGPRYEKPLVIAETGYPFTSANGDGGPNSWDGADPSAGGFDVSVQGQSTALRTIIETLAEVPGGRGAGVFYWEPDWIPVRGAGWRADGGDTWDNQAWWDFQGRPLPSLWTYRLVSESTQVLAPAIVTLPPVPVQTTTRVAPTLPDTVPAVYNDGSWRQVPVAWDAVDTSRLEGPGTFEVSGAVKGTALLATAAVSVTVNEVANAGFESGSLAPWTTSARADGAPVTAFKVEASSPANNTRSGTFSGSYWYGSAYTFTVSQVVKGLTPGTYKAHAWVMGADGTARVTPRALAFFVDAGAGKLAATVVNTGWRNWVEYEIPSIVVGSSGTCALGLEGDMNAGDWGKLDDVELAPQS